jgi:type IV secretion system protein VirB4
MFEPSKVASKEVLGSKHLPYSRHHDHETLVLEGGELLTILEVGGLPQECAGLDEINSHHRSLNALWLNIADERVALWSVLLRRRSGGYPAGSFGNAFADRLDERYRERMNGQSLYRNRLFLAILRVPASAAVAKAKSFLARVSGDALGGVDPDELARHKERVLGISSALGLVGSRTLKLVEDADGLMWSEPATVLHWMLGGREPVVPLTMGPVWSAAYQDRVVFGRETLEVRHSNRTEYAGIFGLKEYPSVTRPTMTDSLLTAPFELTAVQSFRFVAKSAARDLMKKRYNQIVSAKDNAGKQAPLLAHAQEELADNRFCLGEHQGSVMIFADDVKALAENMAHGRSLLMSGGAVVVREDVGLEAAFWAQMPGNMRYRARRAYITSLNFAAMAPFHGYPSGKREANHWGPATALLRTSSGSPYYFSWHVNDVGNTFICGPSGSGKTVVLNFLLAQSLKHNPRIVVFDKDRGCDLFVRAVGGRYFTLKQGMPTGCAPLKAIDINERTVGWFERWIVSMAGGVVTTSDRRTISLALDALKAVPPEMRTISGLRTYLQNTDENGLSARLERWQAGNALGWVFDGDADRIELDARVIGFDMTDVLDVPEIRGPLMDYLFQRCERLINGERLIIAIDEFWKALEDEGFKAFVNDRLKTIRKQNGLIVFATQSPRDALRSTISHSIIEQCSTQILMPNGKATREDYRGGLKLSAREFALVSELLTPQSRRFLVKQGGSGVVAELNLSGFDDELAVLSGRTGAISMADELREELGDDPLRWLPALHQQLKAA